MSKLATALIATTGIVGVTGAGIVGYQYYNNSNTSNTSVQQANTNTAPAVRNNLLGTWIGVDDPTSKVTFTDDEFTLYSKVEVRPEPTEAPEETEDSTPPAEPEKQYKFEESKATYKPLCSSQVIEVTSGELANYLIKATIQGGVLTLETSTKRLRFRREAGDGAPVADTIVQPYAPVKNDLPGTWTESIAEGNDEPLKFTFTTDKMTESSRQSSNYKYLCEGVIETDSGKDRIVVGKVDIVGDELTLVGRGKLFKLKRESSSVDYAKFKEFKSLSGDSAEVYSVAFSPDGKTLASGSDDGKVKLWNVEDGKEIRSISAHSGTVASVAFSPDAKTMASGGYDNKVKLWNVEDGKEISSLSGGLVLPVAFSPDGKTLASGSNDNTIKLWNVEDGKEIRSLSGHESVVVSVAFSPDGKMLASGSSSVNFGPVKLWNVEDGKEIRELSGHGGSVRSLAFSPDGKTLASGSEDNKIKLWNVEDGKEIRSLSGHRIGVISVAFSPDGKTLVSGCYDPPIKLWNVEDGKEIRSISEHKSGVTSVVVSPDGKTLASGSFDKTIKLWRAE